jgi:hypothetical protein
MQKLVLLGGHSGQDGKRRIAFIHTYLAIFFDNQRFARMGQVESPLSARKVLLWFQFVVAIPFLLFLRISENKLFYFLAVRASSKICWII